MRDTLERWASSLPGIPGSCAISVFIGARSSVWEIGWRCVEPGVPRADDLRRLAKTLVGLIEGEGFALLFEPTLVLGRVLDLGSLERVPARDGAELVFRRRGKDAPIDAVGSLDGARALMEDSVLKLSAELGEVFQLSQQQCTEMQRMAHKFDARGGLSDAVGALENELTGMGQALRASFGGHLKDVEGAAACAMDIVKLASAVDQIAQSARLLTFNARLESARLGESGKGFVVIANAIRELANDVRSSNELVTNLAASLVSTLPQLQRATTVLAGTSEAQLEAVRARLASLRSALQSNQQEAIAELRESEVAATAMRDRSQDVIQHLQFQDRTNQLLVRARDQVQALEEVLGVDEAKNPVTEDVGGLNPVANGADAGSVTFF